MSSYRLAPPWGDLIERSSPHAFQFNGRRITGFDGDTVASALLASGVRLVGRSFKLHRPRGIISCGVEEPCGIVDIGRGAHRVPNARTTLTPIYDGLCVESVNCWPHVGFDIAAINTLLAPLLPAGFYYKTFKWPRWQWFEPLIRRMAGLGRVSQQPDPDHYDEVAINVDIVVAGGGIAGLAAAAAAAERGAKVVLVTQASRLGAGAWRAPSIDSRSLIEAAQRAGLEVVTDATVFGLYDHNLVCARQALVAANSKQKSAPALRERLWKFRAKWVVAACGAFERPMIFPDNDRPGVMLGDASRKYAHLYGVACGRRAVISANCDSAYDVARTLRQCGIEIAAIADCRPATMASRAAEGVPVLHDAVITRVKGVREVKGCAVSGTRERASFVQHFDCDLILSAGGYAPAVHLHSQAGGRLQWDERGAMFIPAGSARGVVSVGAAAGIFDAAAAVDHAHRTGQAIASGQPPPDARAPIASLSLPNTQVQRVRGKQFIDLQNDVTSADVALAAQENYRSVEHLKRYTTIGMGTDQGKTSNVNALVLLGAATSRTPPQVGTTKFRPPFVPVSLGTIVGPRRGALLQPKKPLPAESWHRSQGALFEDYGGWQRPAAYPRAGESLEAAVSREVLSTRRSAGLFDGSPLGKMEVFGPDAARFLDFMYVGNISTLPVGKARYGVLLNENGVIVDDGIVARLAPDHFWVNTSSAGAERTAAAFEEWKQCEFPAERVLITAVSSRWATVTIAGPRAWEWLSAAGLDDSLAPVNMPHMSIREGRLGTAKIRVLRASFTGELSYEINIPAHRCVAALEHLWAIAPRFGAICCGVEALQIMRVEKGYIHIGSDTDGTTLPVDIGMREIIARKSGDFVGRRSLQRAAALDPNRLQLIGLRTVDRKTVLPVGGQIATRRPPAASEGHVTSSAWSPELGFPIALALLRAGQTRIGERVQVHHFGSQHEAEVVAPPFVDPQGSRLNG